MNIVFFSTDMNETEGLERLVTEKLQALHSHHSNLSGAQVNFREQNDKTGADKVCIIDLTHYGEPLSVSRRAASYETAAIEAIAELTRRLEQAGKPLLS